ncbi:MAG: glucose 1-dehydrogenase [Thermodesulfobacteriota bacterium]
MLDQEKKQILTVFITGGGGGIGREIARELFLRGMNVVIGDKDIESAKKTAEELDPKSRRTLAVSLDVSKRGEVFQTVETILARFGRVDVLVNNAGISPGNRRITIAEIDEKEWDQVMAVNLKGVFNCSQAVMDGMIKNKSGKIVNIASIAGITGGIGDRARAAAHYAASKAGVIAFTKRLAWELGPFGINVNAIAPGIIAGTGLSLRWTKKNLEKTRQTLPIRRLGKVGDIGKLVAFLISEDASFIQGETIIIDGGQVMR